MMAYQKILMLSKFKSECHMKNHCIIDISKMFDGGIRNMTKHNQCGESASAVVQVKCLISVD
jgi:hypothetical protein